MNKEVVWNLVPVFLFPRGFEYAQCYILCNCWGAWNAELEDKTYLTGIYCYQNQSNHSVLVCQAGESSEKQGWDWRLHQPGTATKKKKKKETTND